MSNFSSFLTASNFKSYQLRLHAIHPLLLLVLGLAALAFVIFFCKKVFDYVMKPKLKSLIVLDFPFWWSKKKFKKFFSAFENFKNVEYLMENETIKACMVNFSNEKAASVAAEKLTNGVTDGKYLTVFKVPSGFLKDPCSNNQIFYEEVEHARVEEDSESIIESEGESESETSTKSSQVSSSSNSGSLKKIESLDETKKNCHGLEKLKNNFQENRKSDSDTNPNSSAKSRSGTMSMMALSNTEPEGKSPKRKNDKEVSKSTFKDTKTHNNDKIKSLKKPKFENFYSRNQKPKTSRDFKLVRMKDGEFSPVRKVCSFFLKGKCKKQTNCSFMHYLKTDMCNEFPEKGCHDRGCNKIHADMLYRVHLRPGIKMRPEQRDGKHEKINGNAVLPVEKRFTKENIKILAELINDRLADDNQTLRKPQIRSCSDPN